MTMTLTSDAFGDRQPIPRRYTCDGDGVSPALTWSAGPVNTAAYALIVDDPDAPSGVFTHWVLYDLPPDVRMLPSGVSRGEQLAQGGKNGKNSFGQLGYGAPCPPHGGGPHRYRFTVYALHVALGRPAGLSKDETLAAMRGHALDTGQLIGTYERQGR
jgi:Raf kinase inhibitor-like YbhB/YbcL family protein